MCNNLERLTKTSDNPELEVRFCIYSLYHYLFTDSHADMHSLKFVFLSPKRHTWWLL